MKASLPFKYITAVKNEKHQIVFDFKDDNGKRKRKWVSTGLSVKCSKKELKLKVDEIVGEFYEDYCSGKATRVKSDKIEKGSISEAVLKSNGAKKSKEYEFTAFMKYWLDTVKPTLAYTTHKAYCNCVRKITTYFDDKFPNVMLGEVTGLMIQQFYNDMYNGGISGNTVKHYHANIHKALKYAVKMNLIKSV
ncbi:MAG: phage integrase SAM-like domain-containing protein [Clostridium sp.]|nr:phage integrase SAM-like domain-containing protein [Clostridium sp.]